MALSSVRILRVIYFLILPRMKELTSFVVVILTIMTLSACDQVDQIRSEEPATIAPVASDIPIESTLKLTKTERAFDTYEGSAVITGEYYFCGLPDNLLYLCFTTSSKDVPRVSFNEGDAIFIVANEPEAGKLLGVDSLTDTEKENFSGKATVEISGYSLFNLEAADHDRSSIVKVISK